MQGKHHAIRGLFSQYNRRRMSSLAELEEQIRRDPDNDDLYRVYGDLLQANGDPRGNLIAIQAEIAGFEPRPKDEPVLLDKLRAAERDVIERHARELLGPLREYCKPLPEIEGISDRVMALIWSGLPITISWHLGFVDSLAWSFSDSSSEHAEQVSRDLARLFAHPSGQFLRDLSLKHSPMLIIAELLAAGLPMQLRHLRLPASASEEVVRLILDEPSSMESLDTLDLSDNDLPPRAVEALRRLPPTLILPTRSKPDAGDRGATELPFRIPAEIPSEARNIPPED